MSKTSDQTEITPSHDYGRGHIRSWGREGWGTHQIVVILLCFFILIGGRVGIRGSGVSVAGSKRAMRLRRTDRNTARTRLSTRRGHYESSLSPMPSGVTVEMEMPSTDLMWRTRRKEGAEGIARRRPWASMRCAREDAEEGGG
jgi:hypothetical protein